MNRAIAPRRRTRLRRISTAVAAAATPVAGALSLLCATSNPSAARAAATPTNWLTATTGNWTDGTKWSGGVSPNNNVPAGVTYDATIAATGAPYTVTLADAIALASLTLDSADATVEHTAQTLTLAGGGGGGALDLKAGTWRLTGGTIKGGTIGNSAGGAGGTFVVPAGGNATLDGVTLARSLTIDRGTLNVANDLTLSNGAVVTLISAGPQANFFFAGMQTLGGTGEVRFGGGASIGNILGAPLGDNTMTIGSGIAVRTGTSGGTVQKAYNYGTISANLAGDGKAISMTDASNLGTVEAKDGGLVGLSGGWFNSGTITVSSSGSVLSMNGLWTNTGTISASAGGRLVAVTGTTNAGGVINATDATLELTSHNNAGGIINVVNSTVKLDGTFTQASLGTFNRTGGTVQIIGTLQNTGATFALDDATGPWRISGSGAKIVGGTVTTSGSAYLEGGGGIFASQTYIQNATLNGDIRASNVLQLQNVVNQKTLLATAGAELLATDLLNNGGITANGGTFTAANAWTNNGTVTASNGGTLKLFAQPAGSGSITATGSNLVLIGPMTAAQLATVARTNTPVVIAAGGVLNHAGQTQRVDDPLGAWSVDGGAVVGGRLENLSAVTPPNLGARGTFDGVILAGNFAMGPYGGFLRIANGLTLEGSTLSLTCDSTTMLTFVNGNHALGGTGEIVLNGSNDHILNISTGTITIGSGVTIRTGTRGGSLGTPGSSATPSFINQGTISSQTAARTINVRRRIQNDGVVEARNGGTLTFSGAVNNYATGTLTGGRWEAHAGSTVNMGSASVVTNAADVVLSGAGSVFAAMNALANNSGSFSVLAGRDFVTAGALANSGKLVAGVGSDLTVSGALSSDPAADFVIEIGGDDANDELFGQFRATGSAALAGELEIRMAGGFVPAVGDTYAVVLAPSVTGTFAGGLTLPPGMAANVIYFDDSVQVQFTAVPEPGAMAGVMLLAAAVAMRRSRFT